MKRTLKSVVKGLAGRTGFEIRRARPTTTKSEGLSTTPYYVPSPSCQVQRLGFLYELYFGQRSDGLFVEVGAFDGYSFSNTSCLAEAGWHGHYIEPVPKLADRCRSRYAGNDRIRVHELAIGAVSAEITIHVGGALSTIDTKTLNEYQDVAWAKSAFGKSETVQAEQITLDQFLERHEIQPGFDLLVVDVEGYECDVFGGFGLDRWRPTMMIVEIADTHPDLGASRSEHARLSRQICDHGYVIVYKDFINTVYLTSECWESTYSEV